ncbi:TrbI/VirB10 family protein [Flexistipes sp.]|uniref:TrbI/VirB10 family protein n=1 Tax=Flexistipes sp. TaxID=3088135 RepID=UPI002E206F1A|nr:TrbI/VirB10 family protein [Flexistipes sp.]
MLDKLKNVFNKDGIQTDDDIIKKKRFMAFGVLLLFIIGILVFSYWSFVQKQQKLHAGKKIEREGLLSKSEKQVDWKSRIEADFSELKQQNKELRTQINSLVQQLKKEKKENEITKQEITEMLKQKINQEKQIIEKTTTEKTTTEENKDAENKLSKDNKSTEEEAKTVNMDILPPPPKPYENNKEQEGYKQYYNKNSNYMKQPVTNPESTTGEEEKSIYVYEADKASLTKDNASQESFYIPSGSFVRGVLLTGVDAPTMQVGEQQPQPVLINLNENTILPNRYRSNMIDCIGIGSARGDLSSERAYIRMVKLSCIEEGYEKKVVDTNIQGWIMGEDGKVGLRGRLVSKQGTILAKALVAGFAEGVANAFTQAASDISVTPEGSTKSIDPDKAFQAAGLEGVGNAMSKLAEFYMKMAESMFPVIEVGAGRNVTMVLKDGKEFVLMNKDIEKTPLKN